MLAVRSCLQPIKLDKVKWVFGDEAIVCRLSLVIAVGTANQIQRQDLLCDPVQYVHVRRCAQLESDLIRLRPRLPGSRIVPIQTIPLRDLLTQCQ